MAVWIMNNKKLGDWLKAAGLKKLALAPGFAFGNKLFEDAKTEVLRQHPEETDPDSRAAYRLLARNKPRRAPDPIVYRPDIPKWLRIGFGILLLGLLSVLAARSQTVIFKDEGVTRVRRAGGQVGIDFVGAGVSCGVSAAGITTCTVSGGGAVGYQTIEDEGTPLTQRTVVNFIGGGVSCVDNGAGLQTDCTVTAGAGATHQIDSVALTAQDPINLLDTSVFDWTNPAAGNISLAIKAASLADSLMASSYSGVGSCTNQFARTLNDDAAPACATVTSTDTSGTFPANAHNLLSATHGDTLAATVVQGDFAIGNVTPAWSRLALGGANLYPKSNGTTVVYSTLAAGGVGSCTNQFVTALNADAVPTCATAVLASAQFANQGATTTVLHGNAAGNPSFGSVVPADMDLTANYVWTGQHDYDTAEILSAIPLRFEGLTDDNIYTTITIVDPTVGRAVTFPNADSNTVQPLACSGTDKFSAVSSLGVFTCDIDQTAGGAFWEAITNSANTATLYTGDNNAETFTINFTSNWATDRLTISQGAGNPTAGSLVTISYTDTDIDALTISDGTDSILVNSGDMGVLAIFPQGAAEIHATEVLINVEKGSAGTITKGQVVYQSGFDAVDNVVEVELADSDAAGTMPAIGTAQESITDTTAGHIVAFGSLLGVDTSSFSVGDPLYVSGTPGALTATKPTGTALIQKVAQVGRSHISLGVIEIFGAGRSNDLPNIANDNIWIGDSSGVPAASIITDCVDTGGNHLNYTQSTNAFACGTSLPSTVVETDQSNTFSTGDQSFAAASSLTAPTAAGAAPTSSADIRYDSTGFTLEYGDNGTNRLVANLNEAQTLQNKTLDSSNIVQAGAYAAASIDSDDLATANKTFDKSIAIIDPVTGDDDKIQWMHGKAVTYTDVDCSTDTGTVTIDMDHRVITTPNTVGTDILTGTIVCDTNNQADGGFADATIPANVPVNLSVTATSGTPGAVRIHIRGAVD